MPDTGGIGAAHANHRVWPDPVGGVRCVVRGVQNRFFISDRAHLVFDFHQDVDGLQEDNLGRNKIGQSDPHSPQTGPESGSMIEEGVQTYAHTLAGSTQDGVTTRSVNLDSGDRSYGQPT
jgi:hypothetical protein